MMPGMKDTKSVRDQALGEKIKMQKRLMRYNLYEAFELFKKDNPEVAIGFSSFANLRPEFCVLASNSGTHSVCVCPIHENVKLALLGNFSLSLSNFRTVLN